MLAVDIRALSDIARHFRPTLAASGLDLGHAACVDVCARTMGWRNGNAASAVLRSGPLALRLSARDVVRLRHSDGRAPTEVRDLALSPFEASVQAARFVSFYMHSGRDHALAQAALAGIETTLAGKGPAMLALRSPARRDQAPVLSGAPDPAVNALAFDAGLQAQRLQRELARRGLSESRHPGSLEKAWFAALGQVLLEPGQHVRPEHDLGWRALTEATDRQWGLDASRDAARHPDLGACVTEGRLLALALLWDLCNRQVLLHENAGRLEPLQRWGQEITLPGVAEGADLLPLTPPSLPPLLGSRDRAHDQAIMAYLAQLGPRDLRPSTRRGMANQEFFWVDDDQPTLWGWNLHEETGCVGRACLH